MTSNDNAVVPDESTYRLPKAVLPEHYDLVLEPDLEGAVFTGQVRIVVEAVEAVDAVVLNAAELDIDEAWLVPADADADEADDARTDLAVELDATTERALLTPAGGRLEAGRHEVHLRFRGVLNDQLRGFYRSVYVDAEGNKATIATTQLESIDARRMFPCFDEPEFKATFGITLVVDEGLTAISNAAEVSDTPTGTGKRRVRFADTMKMSTYLVCCVVGRLEVTEPRMVGSTPVRVVTPPGKLGLSGFSLDVAEFALAYFEHYYGIPYPGDKLDMIAIPDFAAGAMENLGAITYRDTALLVDPDSATHAELERVADVVAHELAHMWFGDLVTMKWWNGIWLNEAFATFMELSAVDAFRPEWQRWTTEKLAGAGAMELDAMASTRPIEYEVRLPSEAEGMFDALTYHKGASVLRMLEQYLGHDGFRDGVRRYLTQHAYDNTETSDLWDALEAATGEPCRQIMDSWIFTGGLPLVTVARGQAPSALELRQRPATFGDDPDPGRTWLVPLILTTFHGAETEEHRVLLGADGATLDVGRDVDAVALNSGGHGFYRTAYGDDLLEALAGRLDRLDAIERFGFVNDLWAAVLAGVKPAAAFVELGQHLAAEHDPNVWKAYSGVVPSPTGAMFGLVELYRILDGDGRQRLGAAVRRFTDPLYAELGWEPAPDEDDATRQLRGVVLRTRGMLGADDDTVTRARAVNEKVTGGGHADPEVRAAAEAVVAHHGTAADFEAFFERYKRAATPQEEVRHLTALGSMPDPGLAERAVEVGLGPEVRTQNSVLVLRRAVGSFDVEAGAAAWKAVRQRWSEVVDRLPRNLVIRLVEGVRGLSTPELAADVDAFFAEHPIDYARRTLDQHLERLRVNVALREREAGRLAEHLG